jgi:hypothetical protein
MLRKINEGGVESDEGFSIQIIGPEILEYRQGKYATEIDMSYDPKKERIYVYASNIDFWIKPVKCEKISNSEKISIISNIKQAVKLLIGNFEVI